VFFTPLLMTGVAVALPFRAGLFNIGAEGQLLAGSVACTVIGIKFSSLPAPILLPMVLLGGTVAGAIWAGIPGVLKATIGAHEVVTTIMLNYVAQWLVRFLIVGGPLQAAHGFSASSPIGTGARLPSFLPNDNSLIIFGLPAGVYRVHTGLLIGFVALAVFAILLWRTSLGYEIRAVGQSQRAARYGGINVARTIIVTMLIAGAFAGLAGAIQIAGVDHNLTDKYFNDTTGFDAIAVALLGLGSAVGILLASILFGALHAGGSVMQADAGISSSLVQILQALILFSIAANFLRVLRLPAFGRRPSAPAPTAPAAALMTEAATAPPGDTT
jgi:simple sugar transport system permease protein